jgi:hypothetical protein
MNRSKASGPPWSGAGARRIAAALGALSGIDGVAGSVAADLAASSDRSGSTAQS